MTGSTISSTSAAITAPPVSIEPPGPKPFRPGPRSPAWPLGHRPSCDRPSCALSRPEPIKLTVPAEHSITPGWLRPPFLLGRRGAQALARERGLLFIIFVTLANATGDPSTRFVCATNDRDTAATLLPNDPLLTRSARVNLYSTWADLNGGLGK